jgi:WD40 repeat protein
MDCITGITPMRDGKPLEFVGGRWNPNGKQLVLFQKAQAGIWLVPLTISNGAPQGDVAEAFPLSDPPGGHETKLGGAVFNKDGSRIVTGGNDQKLKLWSTAAPGHPLAKQDESDPRHQSAPSSLLSLNADGTILAEGLSDGGANLWTIDERGGTIKFLKTVTLPKDVVTSYSGTFEDYTTRAIAFSPRDPHLLLLAQGYHAGVIDIGTEKPTMRLHAQSLVRTRSVILNLAFSRDGSRIASGDSDGYVHVWRYVPSPSEREIYPDLVPLIGGSDTSVPLYRLGFSASGDQLLTVGRDATVRIFDVRPRFGATQRDPGQSASASDQPLPAIAPKSTGTLTVPTQSGGTITLGRVPSGFEAVAVQEYGDWLAVLPKLAMPAYDGETDNRCRPDSGNKSAGADAANARLCDVLLYRKDQTGEPVVSLEAWPKPTPGEEPVYWRDIKFEKGRDAGCAAVTEACIVATTQNGAKYAWPFEPDPKKLGKELKAAEPLDEPDASEYDYQQCLVVGDCGGYDGLKGAN